jgi:SNF family Na+-dependent transporter
MLAGLLAAAGATLAGYLLATNLFELDYGFSATLWLAGPLAGMLFVGLSGLAATSANEFCEVALGGLITIPAAVAFLGAAGAVGGTFALGFNVLPLVFMEMPGGAIFGFCFFFLLFLAAVTSSLSMLQPGIAFLENALSINRQQSVAILGFITGMGTLVVVYFSKDLKALDTLDFWIGTFLIFVLATIQIVVFAWVMGIPKGFAEASKGASFNFPAIYGPIMKYVTPVFLLGVFFMWTVEKIFGYNFSTGNASASGYIEDLFGPNVNQVAWLSVCIILMLLGFVFLIVNSSPYFRKLSHIVETNKGEEKE